MITLQETVDFVLANYAPAKEWEPKLLANWITWASNKGFLFHVCAGAGLAGMAIARPVAHVNGQEESTNWHDETGNFIFVDLAIAKTRAAQQATAFGILARFGERDFVAFRRKGKLKIHRTRNARRALLRLKDYARNI